MTYLKDLRIRPDGDMDIEGFEFMYPNCEKCQGILMPDVTFFGGSVDKKIAEK